MGSVESLYRTLKLISHCMLTNWNLNKNIKKKTTTTPLSKTKGNRRHGAPAPRGQHRLPPRATEATWEKAWLLAGEEMTLVFHRTSREAPSGDGTDRDPRHQPDSAPSGGRAGGRETSSLVSHESTDLLWPWVPHRPKRKREALESPLGQHSTQ